MSTIDELMAQQEAELIARRKHARRPIDKSCEWCVAMTNGVGRMWCIWFGTDACKASREQES